MISVENATVRKGDVTVMSIDRFDSVDGGITCLVGPSGCGKSTLLNCLGLLEHLDGGVVVVDDVDVTRAGRAERLSFWRNKAAFVFQDYGIIDEWTALENVLLRPAGRLTRSSRTRAALEVLDRVGLEGRHDEQAARFSGGEKQRISIARALHKNAVYVFADEPTASLDDANRAAVIAMLRELTAHGASVVVATHDEEMVAASDRTYRLRRPETRAHDDGA